MATAKNSSASHNTRGGCICTIVPPTLLAHIRDSDAASPRARNAAAQTLAHSRAFRSGRGLLHTGNGNSHGPQHAIVPPQIFQAIIDSDDASPDEKHRAQKNLNISSALRVARGDEDRTAAATPGLHRILYNANKHSRLPGKEVREEGGEIAVTLKEDVDFQRVWDTFGDTYNFYQKFFDRNSIDGQGMDIIASIHYDEDDHPPGFNNAMWDSSVNRMIFGDGDGEIFTSFTGSIDVIAHELTHGVTDFTANLPYHKQSGALNESMSDVFGSMVKQWVKGQTVDKADWLIGEGIFVNAQKNKALRSMAAPGTAYQDIFGSADDQPSHMDGYDNSRDPEDWEEDQETGDHGGVHKNSGIPNHAFFLAAMKLGGNSWTTLGPIWYNALTDPSLRIFARKPPNFLRCFKFFADLTVKHAGTDPKKVDAVEEAWTQVGVFPS